MKKNKQINFRLSADDLLRFRAIAFSHGMDATDYFRAKFLDVQTGAPASRPPSTQELEKRAKAAEKLIILRDIEKKTDPIRLRKIYIENLINISLEEIARYAATRVELNQDASLKNDKILIMLEEIQNQIMEKCNGADKN